MSDYFKDAGSKLKVVINAVFTLIIILHILAVFILLFQSISNENFLILLIGILVLGVSLYFSWLALLTVAAFADMAVNTSKLAADIADIKFYLQHSKHNDASPSETPSLYCPQCGRGQPADAVYCFACSAKLR